MDDCTTIMKFMSIYLDGELDVKESIRTQSHLQECPDCRETMLVENAFRDLVREQAAPTPAPDVTREGISAALARERRERAEKGTETGQRLTSERFGRRVDVEANS